MLAVVLTILKVIGLILLVLLALVIAAILLVLLVPIRYRASGAKYETIRADADVRWLFKLLHVLFSFDNAKADDKMSLVVKVLGFTVYSNQKKEKDKEAGTIEPEPAEAGTNEPVQEQIREEKKEEEQEPPASEEDQPAEPEQEYKPEESVQNQKAEKDKKKKPAKKKNGPSAMERFQRKLESLQRKAEEIRVKKDRVMKIIEDEKNQRWLSKVLMRLKSLILYLIPQIDKLYLHFGFKDPASTGKMLGMLSLLYPVCEDRMDLEPEFAMQIMEGEGAVKGRIRLIRALAFAVPSFVNPTFFKLIKQIKNI